MEKARTWLYGVTLAGVPLLVAYGAIDKVTAPLWVAFGGAVLGLGTALVNRPTRKNK